MDIEYAMHKHIVSIIDVLPKCDICGTPTARYDAKTVSGPWGYMCHTCWLKFRAHCELGLGKGQMLVTPEEIQGMDGLDFTDEDLIRYILSKDCKYDHQTLLDHMLAMKDDLAEGNAILIKAGSLPECLPVIMSSEDVYEQINIQASKLLNKKSVCLRDITYYNTGSCIVEFKADDDPDNDYSVGNFFNNYPIIVICKEDCDNDCLVPFTESDLITIADILFENQSEVGKTDIEGISGFSL